MGVFRYSFMIGVRKAAWDHAMPCHVAFLLLKEHLDMVCADDVDIRLVFPYIFMIQKGILVNVR